MEVKREDIVTPANALSTAGLALTLVGSANIDKVSGVAMIGAGRVLDLADGYVARRTHTSEFGGVVDATFDKLAVAAFTVQAWRHDTAPQAIIAGIVMFNVVNAVANVYTDRKGHEAKSSKAGKYGMFGQNMTLGAFTMASALGGNAGLEAAGVGLAAASMPYSVKASYDYMKSAAQARASSRPKHLQKRNQKR